ncbi:putative transcriptional regulatory protein ZraR [Bacteriovorax sp. BSW11_IV]|uniref:sigma-54-dependent transcriptional regulator n=1 Tax=Bacteriovorax sp. BSW11_IV TaxID=1353529 RepID=UPI000389ED37|nr:sigma-54 dependent transcriptional regulator [Bacteriovorax sp. BSW11_IV]EQC45161.1 putative transcriptional regulatory protein ZraR [Bacteriovorax sp. BSW11_IV]
MYRVLVVDDDKVLQDNVRQALEFHHFNVDVANNGKEAVGAVYREKYDLVVMDVNMPEMTGIEALAEIKKYDPSIIVIILTAYSNVTDAVKAVKEGAYNYLEKPITSENLVALIKRALKARSLVETSMFSAPTLSLGQGSDQFVGESDVMKKVFNVISKLAQVNTPVLIRGESGTGKELVAKAIHFNGPRKDEKFVTINLAAIPDNLIESELFGHEKGAFTGATERKIGKFQYADGGTIFLDEIGDVSPTMQVKLLRVLQEKTFTPVGSNRDIKCDVRVIAASHKPFEKMIKEGTFREDLFYRLNVLPVYLPPLRERKDDINFLVEYYLKYFNNLHNLQISGFTPDAMEAMKNYSWPGNIRELRNVIEHSFIIESTDTINFNSLPETVKKNSQQAQTHIVEDEEESIIDFEGIKESVLNKEINESEEGLKFTFKLGSENDYNMDFQVAKELFEKQFIIEALRVNKGKINQTALKANIPKKTLLRKIEKYEINPKEYY